MILVRKIHALLSSLFLFSSSRQRRVKQKYFMYWVSQVAHTVKNPPAILETWVPSLGQEDPLDDGMATHSSILAWRIPQREENDGLQSMGSERVGHN